MIEGTANPTNIYPHKAALWGCGCCGCGRAAKSHFSTFPKKENQGAFAKQIGASLYLANRTPHVTFRSSPTPTTPTYHKAALRGHVCAVFVVPLSIYNFFYKCLLFSSFLFFPYLHFPLSLLPHHQLEFTYFQAIAPKKTFLEIRVRGSNRHNGRVPLRH